MRWNWPSRNESRAVRFAQQAGISQVLAGLLLQRGFNSVEAVQDFLSPSLQRLADPLAVEGMPEAVARVQQGLRKQESILIFGDYDVDGVTSTAFLIDFLQRFGSTPRFVVPKRLEEGYGLSIDTLERALAEGKPDLLIAVDCGTSSVAEISWLQEQGISVVVLDHHTSAEVLPEDTILVNPHARDAADVPWKNLCSVGLVFKFCHAFLKVMREAEDPTAEELDLREYLDLVALGTVSDLVSLNAENRILVKFGLQRLKNCRRPGVCALIEVAGLSLGDTLSHVDIGYRLGPRINASGRLDDASVPISLLLSEDWTFCRKTADELDAYNVERQTIERAISEEAEGIVTSQFAEDSGIILFSDNWHAGVVGIVASRLARKFNRPALVFGADADGLLKGSGRSVEGVNLVEVLSACDAHIEQWGGHPMAVGLTVREPRLQALRESFNEKLRALFPDGIPRTSLNIDAAVLAEELTESLLEELARLAPFGQGNPEPVFGLSAVSIKSVSPMGKNHYRFTLERENGPPLQGVAWNGAGNVPPLNEAIDLAVRFHWNQWRGSRSPRLTLLAWRPSAP